MNPQVRQMRDSFHDGIIRNPSRVNFLLSGVPIYETVRLTHESASVPSNKSTPTGLGTSFTMFVEAHYNSQIFENAVLKDGVNGWKVGAVDSLKINGTIYGKRATLVKVTI